MHHWSGPHGVPGGLERWQHGSYRWRRGLEAVLLVVVAVVLAPTVLVLAEVIAGAGMMALGLLMLGWWTGPRRRRHRYDVLALLVAIVALVEARKRRV
jgi:uncharacterized membrane protein YdcZ (DUF606 family)